MARQRVPVTQAGLDRLKAELDELKTVKRQQLSEIVAEARSHGDLRENAAYDVARQDQMMNERRIADLQDLLRNSELVAEGSSTGADSVGLHSRVIVDFDGEEEQYVIVGAIEAKPAAGKISNESPMGQALLGKRPGDIVEVPTPIGPRPVTILRIE